MNEKLFESTKLAQPTLYVGDYWQHLCYVSTWDAFLAQSIHEWCKVFRDGTKVRFGKPSGSYTMLGRVKGFPAYCTTAGIVYSAFEINGLPNPNERLNPNWTIPSALRPTSLTGTFIDDVNQVYLDQPSANRIDTYSLETGVKVGEIVHNTGEYFASLSWVQQGQVAGLCKTSGKVCIMDYLSSEPQVVATGSIDPCKVAAYDTAFKLFVSIGADHKVRVYNAELLPTGLSAPVFTPVTVTGFNANEVKVRLTGHGGEPLVNWWVNWELEGVGGEIIGSLDKYGSLTNADGYASNLYIGPDDGSTGQCKIKASVVLP